jgi:kynurenine formamidase
MAAGELSAKQIREQLSGKSNWGRWGADDQRGAINLIDARKRCEAAALVRTGRTVSLSRDYPKGPAANNPRPAQHYMRVETKGDRGGYSADYYGIDYHGFAATHVDALCHVWDENGAWNGRDPSNFLTSEGATWGGIENWRDGVTTRGVLFDVPAHRGSPYVRDGSPVQGEELRVMADEENVALRPGDAIVVYSGRGAYERDHGPWASGPMRPGLDASCLWFIRESDCSVLVWDMMEMGPRSHDGPVPFTLHGGISSYGMALVDNARLEDLAVACSEEGRYEFMLTFAPLPVVGGTGSPVNPIALF